MSRYGRRLYELARGVDDSDVVPDRPTQSISVEDTFERDVLLTETAPTIQRLAARRWSASRKEPRTARTVVGVALLLVKGIVMGTFPGVALPPSAVPSAPKPGPNSSLVEVSEAAE